MSFPVRRLGPGDEPILAVLAAEDEDFDLADRGSPRDRLSPEAACAFLSDPRVLHWVAEDGAVVVGHMYCHVLRKRAGAAEEVLLYEIGVREAYRRRGVGRDLVRTMTSWMERAGIREAWVVADNEGAVSFYRACGFDIPEVAETPVYMSLDLPARR